MKRIVFGEFYRDERIFEVARILRIELVDMSRPGTLPQLPTL